MQNLLDPAILFFVFGMFAGAVRSNLEIPAPFSRFLSLYLLMSLGLKGGFALAKSGLTFDVAAVLLAAISMALLVPALGFWVLRRLIGGFDAAALAATYGSVSAVTFITATQYLETQGIAFGGYMAAAMALMESPAIVMAVLLANVTRRRLPRQDQPPVGSDRPASIGPILRESLTDGAQLLLLGSMFIGILSGEAGRVAMQPFTGDLFKGMLAFFLLDMGLLTSRNAAGLRGHSLWLPTYAIGAPMVHAAIALVMARMLDMSAGNGALLMILSASASYIAVPAVVRHAIPEANPSLYFGMSLGFTFPFNILIGIPTCVMIARTLLR